jgi:hypothetical protein
MMQEPRQAMQIRRMKLDLSLELLTSLMPIRVAFDKYGPPIRVIAWRFKFNVSEALR